MSIVNVDQRQILPDERIPVVVSTAAMAKAIPQMALHCTKLMYITSGASRFTFSEGTAKVTAGMLVTIPEGCWCAATPMGTLETVSMYADTKFLHEQARWVTPISQVLKNLDLIGAFGTRIRIHKLPAGRGKRLEKHLKDLATLQHLELQEFTFAARLTEFFGDLSSLRVPERAGAGERLPVNHALHLLHRHLDRQWKITDLAREVALSPSQLTRVFRQQVGCAPAEYLSRIRADAMAGLLIETKLSVAEVARQVGWIDGSHASRSFKRHYRVSPSNYLAAHRKDSGLAFLGITPRKGPTP